jgi:hypothetical protein
MPLNNIVNFNKMILCSGAMHEHFNLTPTNSGVPQFPNIINEIE